MALAEASSTGKDIFSYAPQSNGANDYMALCKEFINRVKKTIKQMEKKELFNQGFDSLLTTTKSKENKSSAEPPKEKMTTANFRIPVSLHKELKKLAVEREQTLMDLIADAIREYISKCNSTK